MKMRSEQGQAPVATKSASATIIVGFGDWTSPVWRTGPALSTIGPDHLLSGPATSATALSQKSWCVAHSHQWSAPTEVSVWTKACQG